MRIVCQILMMMILGLSVHGEKLYVFFPSTVQPKTLKEQIKAQYDGDVEVFARYKDFTQKVQEDNPEAVLTKPLLLQGISGYSTVLKGVRKGDADEKFLLVSVDKPLDPSAISEETIGILDFLGKKSIIKFVSTGFSTPPKLNRVIKNEDLIPLLNMNMAAGVLVPEFVLEYLKKESNLNFQAVETDLKTEIISLAVKEGVQTKAAENIKKFNSSINKNLGVEKWQ